MTALVLALALTAGPVAQLDPEDTDEVTVCEPGTVPTADHGCAELRGEPGEPDLGPDEDPSPTTAAMLRDLGGEL